MTFRVKYWSCTKFANWVRGTPKLSSGTNGEWNKWTKESKTAHPFRYWLAEEGLDKVQDFVNFPYDITRNFTYWFKKKYIDKSWMIDTGLTPGEYHECDTRILHGLFNLLVEFVECEKAWMMYISHSKKYNKVLPFWKTKWPFRHFTEFRFPSMGLNYLRWESKLLKDSPFQAEKARKILELYHWWKNVRPNRPEPMVISGWSDYCNKYKSDDYLDKDYEDYSAEQKDESNKALDALHKLEEKYENEDTEMLIRLIKIRQGLWT